MIHMTTVVDTTKTGGTSGSAKAAAAGATAIDTERLTTGAPWMAAPYGHRLPHARGLPRAGCATQFPGQ